MSEHPLCAECERAGRVVAGTEVDHIVPHRGDKRLFWDRSNWQTLCRACHSRKTAVEDSGFAAGGGLSWHPSWLGAATVPVTVVCGAVAAGKTSWVAARAGDDDLVIDLDAIVRELTRGGAPSVACASRSQIFRAGRVRNNLLARLTRAHCPWPAAWLIVAEPRARWRKWWDERLRPSGGVVVLETPVAECVRRVRADAVRRLRERAQVRGVMRWWELYEPRDGDRVVRFEAGAG